MPVHRSLLGREMTAGVPQTGLMLLLLLIFIFVLGMELYFMLIPVVILYLVMRALSKKDEWMIDIVLENIMQKDVLLP